MSPYSHLHLFLSPTTLPTYLHTPTYIHTYIYIYTYINLSSSPPNNDREEGELRTRQWSRFRLVVLQALLLTLRFLLNRLSIFEFKLKYYTPLLAVVWCGIGLSSSGFRGPEVV